MSNIVTYVQWRGDLTFEEKAFGEVDNLILSQLSYLDLAGIVPGIEEKGKSITIGEALTKYKAGGRGALCVGNIGDDFVDGLIRSKRFSGLELSRMIDLHDVENTNTDFAALQIRISDHLTYVAFRGTGDELIGWKEDFSMSFQLMPAQKLAEKYIKDTVSGGKEDAFIFGGHSKGGNLAVYAAVTAPKKIQDKIQTVYSNDGPGFCEEVIPNEKIDGIREKIIRIVPEFSVVGALFETEAKTVIVRSNLTGVGQHDAMSWQVDGDHFVTVSAHSNDCNFVNDILGRWIESGDLEHREAFTNDFFGALEDNGVNKITELSQNGADDFLVILLTVTGSGDKTKDMIIRFGQTVLTAFQNIKVSNLLERRNTGVALALFILGAFVALRPNYAIEFMGLAVGVVATLLLGKRLLDTAFSDKGKEEARKTKVVVLMLGMCIMMYLVAEREFLLKISNLIIGASFLLFAYYWLNRAFRYKKIFPKRIIGLTISALSFMLGILPIVTDAVSMNIYLISVGASLCIYGVSLFVYQAYKAGKGLYQ